MKKKALLLSCLALSSIALSGCGKSSGGTGYTIEEADNAGGSAFYQIFVGSFADSNGDGVGDLKGIEGRLDYLKSLGVSNLWLTPVHPSSSYHKYNVKDYYAIDESFGTLEDFDSLVASARSKGIGIIMDMVFNHTAADSVWFKNFETACRNKGKEGYEEYAKYEDNFCFGRTPKDGWTLFPTVGYVETNFDSSMPELNFDSSYVREELKNIQNYWLDRGVAGFRYDAVKYFYCTNSGGVITGNTEKNVAALQELAESAKAKKADVYLIGENWVDDMNEISEYYASGMNFFSFPTAGLTSSGSAGKMLTRVGAFQFSYNVAHNQEMIREKNPDGDLAFFVSNHDTDRWGDYWDGDDRDGDAGRKAMASAYLLTPGTPFMYYGEEISMLGSRGPNEMTDAMRRQAMVWGDASITCEQPEHYEVEEQTSDNVKKAVNTPYSTINHYRKVLSIRNKYKDLFRKGKFEAIEFTGKRLAAFKITLESETYYLIHNVSDASITASIEGAKEIVEEINTKKVAPTFDGVNLTLAPYSSALLK